MTGVQFGVGGDATDQGWPAKPMRITELTVPMTWSLRAKDTPCPVCGGQIAQLTGRRQAADVELVQQVQVRAIRDALVQARIRQGPGHALGHVLEAVVLQGGLPASLVQ